MPTASIKLLLYEKIGLNADSIGESSIQRAINHRLAQLEVVDISEYYALLLEDSKELRELIEEIVVPETWFFRNKKPFEAFVEIFNQHILPKRNNKKKIRILSIPSSTGEEPYSLAIALYEQEMKPKDVEITAVDISQLALKKAKSAVYLENSFRDMEDNRIKKYFEKRESGYHLIKPIQEFVKFKQGNIFVGSLSPHPGYFDVVFCRNLLIYFDREKQQTVLEKLYRSIKKNGALFVGHAESSMVSENYFSRIGDANAFSFLKKSVNNNLNKDRATNTKANTSDQLKTVKNQLLKINKARSESNKKCAIRESQVNNKLSASLKKDLYNGTSLSFRPVEKLIAEEKNQEALDLCEQYLERDKNSAQGHYLLALLKYKNGEVKKAQSLLKKAIFLDQNHEAALILSSELAKQDGDMEATKSYERRIERLRKQSKDLY